MKEFTDNPEILTILIAFAADLPVRPLGYVDCSADFVAMLGCCSAGTDTLRCALDSCHQGLPCMRMLSL